MQLVKRLIAFVVTGATIPLGALFGAGAALADGEPQPWQIGMQAPVTPVGQDIYGFNTFLFWITTAIAVAPE